MRTFQPATRIPSTTSSSGLPDPARVAAHRRRCAVERVPQVEGEGQQRRADEPRDRHRPERRRADRDRDRVRRGATTGRRGASSSGARPRGSRAARRRPRRRRPGAGGRAPASGGTGSPGPPASPPGTSAAAPTNATNPTSSVATGPPSGPPASAPGRRRGSAPRGPASDRSRKAVAASAGSIRTPTGTSEMAPMQPIAATAGRMSDSIGTPCSASGASSWPSTWSEPSRVATSSRTATTQLSGPSSRRASPTMTTTSRARSRRVGGDLERHGPLHATRW